jgi:cytochrome c-type biogenesis protein CcmF
MNEIQYVGENLVPGQLGHLAVMLSFVGAIMAAIAYFFATNNRNNESYDSWRKLGRIAFGIHGLSVFVIIGTIFYLMVNQLFEYSYAYEHTSPDLPIKYIASAFWEGQEGSFLLWMFWHVVLGGILIFSAKKWESPVLSVIAMVQIFLMTMILGLYFGVEDVKFGSNPFALLRNTVDAPIFSDPEYLSKIAGDGLNPLLQNYWMTIHPPTLFLGFASTVVPFAFAIAGLWTRDFKGWLKPVLSWSLFSAFILGLGILMGGAWAYEALSFGGYWAWDPVENMSLVPWLVLIAGIHAVMIAKNTGHSLKISFLFMIASFGMIVYSTFLTRSGILGDTSVHAFTDMGLEWQLVIFLGTIFFGSLILLFTRWRQIPEKEKEETAYSREFWMFMGSLVLIFSAILISFTTSIPVYNKIASVIDGWFPNQNFALNWSTPTEPIKHYNKYQIWIAVLITIISGIAQFMRYKAPSADYLKKVSLHVGISAAAALAITVATYFVINLNTIPYLILMFASVFGIIANTDYVIFVLRGNIKISAAAVSHIGFAVMIIGTIVSGLNKEIISRDAFMRTNIIEGFSEDNENNNILLYRNLPTRMGEYMVTYQSDTIDGFNRHFIVNYKRMTDEGKITEEFNLTPNIIYDKNEPKIAASNPSTKRYLHRDIFTHVSALPRVELEPEYARQVEDSLKYQTYEIETGETLDLAGYEVTFIDFNKNPKNKSNHTSENDIVLGATLKIKSKISDSTWTAEPIFMVREDGQFGIPEELTELGLKIKFSDKFSEIVAQTEENLTTKIVQIAQGGTFEMGDYNFILAGFNQSPQNENYMAKEGDIAVAANISVFKNTKKITTAEPVMIIRNNQILNVPEELREHGIRLRFQSINPENGIATLEVSTGLPAKQIVALDIAQNINRSDYIVMEAIVFPGINMFWIGSLMMLFGFLQGLVVRLRLKN